MTDQEWRDLADELERMADDYDDAGDEFKLTTADSLVQRIRWLIQSIRDAHKGN